jgi:hypothetical protein
MIVSIIGRSCYVYKQDGDPMFRPNKGDSSWSAPGWYGAESRLLYHVQKILNQRGYDLLKKKMWKDGHMFGTDHSQYLRSRDFQGAQSLCIYHANHAVEIAAELFNKISLVELAVEYGLTEPRRAGAVTTASLAFVKGIEATHPCYEVSWDAPADLKSGIMTSGPERFRHYKGCTDPIEATAFLNTNPGEYPRLINRLTGELITSVV